MCVEIHTACLFKIGQYCLSLLNSPQGEACEHLFKGLLVYLALISMERSLENYYSMDECIKTYNFLILGTYLVAPISSES